MMQIRDVLWENGGATFVNSVLPPDHPEALHPYIPQVVSLPDSRAIWIKDHHSDWQKVELAMMFGVSGRNGDGSLSPFRHLARCVPGSGLCEK